MGKGDKKTKRGKIIMGSYGVRRPKRQKSNPDTEIESTALKTKTEKPAKDEAVKEKKKTAAKKANAEIKEETPIAAKKKTTRKPVEKETGGHEEEK